MYREIQTPPDVCPACERYIDTATVCPYCDADTKQAPRFRRFRILALVMLLAGATGMLLVDDKDPHAITPIGSIGPDFSHHYAHVSGRVVRPPYIVEEEDVISYLSFMLEDETGRMRIQIDASTAQALRDADTLPWEGSALNAQGWLKLAPDGEVKLQVRHRKHITFLTHRTAD